MKIVSVMTTDSSGGAEFAAVEMLEALRQRGHETVMLTDMAGIGRDTGVTIRPIEIGPKLSTGSWVGAGRALAGAARAAARGARGRGALRRAARPLQEGAADGAGCCPPSCAATVVWAEWGPVPFPLRKGLPRRAYLAAASGCRW